MGYGTDGLTFNTLRGGNRARLPQFKNRHGELAHKKPDGSDWTPAQWLQALVGELGEWATERVAYENGEISVAQYQIANANELPDPLIYLDLLAMRSLDVTAGPRDPALVLMEVIAGLGTYANARKKYERGDYDKIQLLMEGRPALIEAMGALQLLVSLMCEPVRREVMLAHPTGVNLGRAAMDKFNATSVKVGSTVRIDADDWHLVTNPDGNG